MAVQLPDSLYTGGATIFPQDKYTQFGIQLMARKKAQEDAIDDYYKNLDKTLNPAGVRYVDMPGFQKRVEELTNFTIKNKDALKKGNIPAQLAREQLFRDAQSYIVGSKDAATGDKEGLGILEKFRTEDKNAEPIFERLRYNQLPLDDPNFKRINTGEFLQSPKTFDEMGYFNKFSKIPRNETVEMGKVGKDGYRIDTISKTLPKDKLEQIATQAMADYHDVWSFNDRVNDVIKNPAERDALASFYQQQFGKRPETNAELAAAYVLRGVNPVLKEQGKPVRDEVWMLNYKQGLEKQMKQWENDLKLMTEEQKNTWLKDYLTQEGIKARTDEFGKQKDMKIYNLGGGVSYQGNELPVTAFISKGLTKNGQTPFKVIVSDVNVVQPDGQSKLERKFIPLYYKTDEKGKRTEEIDKELSTPQDIDQLVIDMGGQVGVKQKNIEGAALVGKKPETKTKTITSSAKGGTVPSATKDEWLSAGWTEDQIKKAVKDGKIIVK